MNPFDNYRVSSAYGSRWGTMHRGIDLVRSHKAPIESFTGGKVVFAGATKTGTGLGNYGNTVVVQDDSPRKALHLYAHLDSVAVAMGDAVEVGQVIGKQGNTGDVSPKPTASNPAAGSHLHYEVRLQSSPSYGLYSDTDPMVYLNQYSEWRENMLKELQEEVERLKKQLAKLAPKKAADQQVAVWAQDGHKYVIDNKISDGERPEDPVTRQEVWAMFERASK